MRWRRAGCSLTWRTATSRVRAVAIHANAQAHSTSTGLYGLGSQLRQVLPEQ